MSTLWRFSSGTRWLNHHERDSLERETIFRTGSRFPVCRSIKIIIPQLICYPARTPEVHYSLAFILNYPPVYTANMFTFWIIIYPRLILNTCKETAVHTLNFNFRHCVTTWVIIRTARRGPVSSIMGLLTVEISNNIPCGSRRSGSKSPWKHFWNKLFKYFTRAHLIPDQSWYRLCKWTLNCTRPTGNCHRLY